MPPQYRMKGATPPAQDTSAMTPDSFMATQQPVTPAVTTPPASGNAQLTPDSFMASQSSQQSQTPPDNPGILTKAWRWATNPTISGEQMTNAASSILGRPSDMLPGESPYQYLRRNQSYVNMDHPYLAAVRAGLSGAVADTMDLAGSFTSPASIAMAGAGAAGRVPGAVGKIAKAAQLIGAGGFAAKGAGDVIDTATKEGNYSPDDIQKLFYGGAQLAGGTAGVGDAVAGSSPSTGARIMNRIIRPSAKAFKWTNPGEAVLNEGLTGNSTQDLADNIATRREQVGQDISNLRKGPSGQAVSVDATKAILDPINDAMQQAQTQGRADLYQKLQTFQDQLTKQWAPDSQGNLQPSGPRKLSGLNAQDLYDLKHQVDNLTKFYGTPFQDEFNQVKVAVRSNLRDLENQALPQVAPYRYRYSGLKAAGDAADNRAATVEKNAAISLPDYVLQASGLPAGMLAGHTPEGLAAGTGAVIIKHALQSPAVQTRVAQWLGHEGPTTGIAATPVAATAGAQKPKWKWKPNN